MTSTSGMGAVCRRSRKAAIAGKSLPRPFIFQFPATSGLIAVTFPPPALGRFGGR